MQHPQAALIVETLFFFFNDTATTEIYTLSLHDALPIHAALDQSDDDADDEHRTERRCRIGEWDSGPRQHHIRDERAEHEQLQCAAIENEAKGWAAVVEH